MIRALSPREFTQGTIFTCATAENYNDSVLGLVITARCDAAHDKVEIFNYVPVVPVDRWMLRDGRHLLARRAIAGAQAALKATLVDAGMAPSILDAMPADRIKDELTRDTSRRGASIATRFIKAQEHLNEAEIASEDGQTIQEAFRFLETRETDCRKLIRDLLANGLAEFHFLDRSYPGEDSPGYVALLREIRFVPARLAKAIAGGLDKETYDAIISESQPMHPQLRLVGEDAFCLPIGAIESPYIELIMQRLTQLFARVGVVDLPRERSKSVESLIETMRKGFQ